MSTLDKKLKETEHIKARSWGKVISNVKRQFDHWALQSLFVHGYSDFKMSHMPFIMNIAPEGTNNNDLAKRARVTKQAMSKVAKEMQELGYVEARTDDKDKRSTIFFLTEKGKKFVIAARLCVHDLTEEYRQLVGKAKFESMIDTLEAIIAYNDTKYPTDES